MASQPEVLDPGAGLDTMSNDALLATTRGEIDIQIATAKKWPRSLTAFRRQASEMVSADRKTAKSMWFTLPPRKGDDEEKKKPIVGPSVRLAEICASAWGNHRTAARIVGIDEEFVTAQGLCLDLERNVAYSVEVKRAIKTKTGRRYSLDMIRTTAMAACSIAFREAVFKMVPRAYVNGLWKEAEAVALGEGDSAKRTMPERREEAAKEFMEKTGCKKPEILAVLERKGWDDVTIDDLVTIHGYMTAIEDGELTWASLQAQTIAASLKPVGEAPDAATIKARKAAAAGGVIPVAEEPEPDPAPTPEAPAEPTDEELEAKLEEVRKRVAADPEGAAEAAAMHEPVPPQAPGGERLNAWADRIQAATTVQQLTELVASLQREDGDPKSPFRKAIAPIFDRTMRRLRAKEGK